MIQFPSPYEKKLPHEIVPVKICDDQKMETYCDRVVGSLVGLAVGDALGASVEFRPRQYLVANPVLKMEGGGTWGLEAGKWTDDTSMALCLAASLISEKGFNPYDQMVRYKWWFKHGYLSSTGHCFDIGKATRSSLIDFSDRQKILKTSYRCRSEDEVDRLALESVNDITSFKVDCGDISAAGNGALMRLAPIPLFYFGSSANAVEYAARSASLTHADRKAIDACRYYAALIVGAVRGLSKDQLLDESFFYSNKNWFGEEPLHPDIISIAEGSFKKPGGYEQGIRGKGYVVNSLEAALWAFWSGKSFEEGALAAVNLGDDTDTTAAIYGQLAGAHYGYKDIPKDWLGKLYARDLLVSIGQWLYKGALAFQPNDSDYDHVSNLDQAGTSSEQQAASTAAKFQQDHSTGYETSRKQQTKLPYSKEYSVESSNSPKANQNRRLSLESPTNVTSAPDHVKSSDSVRSDFLNGNSFSTSNEPSNSIDIPHKYPFKPPK